MEEWRNIKGFAGYQVSNQGRVRSVDIQYEYIQNGKRVRRMRKGKVLSPCNNGKGYMSVQLGRKKRIYIHRLVAQAFIPNPLGLSVINHLNGIRHDNRVQNLEWTTQLENTHYKYVTGTMMQGTSCHYSKLTDNDIPIIRTRIANGLTQREVAEEFGVTQTTISAIIRGEAWKHVGMS
ncbi:MAG: hypothetical protein ACFWTY_01360 [Shouchella clausii]|jgi:hypothetical protein